MSRYAPLIAAVFAAAVLALSFAAVAQQEVKQITFGDGHDRDPMVSPDGKYLAFASDRTGEFNIYLFTFGQSGVTQLTQSEKDDRHPHWSPDSAKVVFSSRRTGNGDIYVTELAGRSGYLQLTDREDYDEYPSYQPRGGALLFATAPKKFLRVMPDWDIALAAEGRSANSARTLGEGMQPRFSPDGGKIVFVSKRTKNRDVWVMDADGGLQTQLTTDEKDDQHPCFSPDGRQIVFASERTGESRIWVMDADGGNKRQLTTGPGDETQPCWSAGGYIYFVRQTDTGQSNIYQMKAPD
jgi:Tol biopolymer transport system component